MGYTAAQGRGLRAKFNGRTDIQRKIQNLLPQTNPAAEN
jgi:hypothetical protein